MNCCNEYGQCTDGHDCAAHKTCPPCHGNCNQGRDCPARQACELPELPSKPRYTQRPANRTVPTLIADLLACAVAVLAIVWLTAYYGPSLDTDSAADAQAQAVQEFHRDLAAARMCREQHGASLVRWTVDGQAVCVPVQVSSNP